MSIQTVEIALPTGIDSVSVGLAESISIVEVRQGPAGEAGAAGATGPAGPNTLTTATTTNLTGFISGNGTNISGATAAASAATPSTLVLRDANGGASFGAVNVTALTASGITTDGQIEFNGADAGDSLTFNMVNYFYGAGAASAHRTALGLGTGDSPTFAGATFAGLIEQRNGNEAQTLRIYRTFTDENNFRRLSFTSVANEQRILAQAGGTGAAMSLNLGSGNAPQWQISTSGHLLGYGDNNFDIGSVSANRPRDLHLARNAAIAGTLSVTGASTFGDLIEQRNGLNQQESRIYGTYTGPGNYRRLALKMDTAGVAQIVAEGGGSGASGNRLEFVTGGATRMTVTSAGNVGVGTSTPTFQLDADGTLAIGKITDTTSQGELMRLRVGSSGGSTGYISFKRAGGGNASYNFGLLGSGTLSIRQDGDSADAWSISSSGTVNSNKTFIFGSANGTISSESYFYNSSSGVETLPIRIANPSTGNLSNCAIGFRSINSVGTFYDYAKITGIKIGNWVGATPVGGIGFSVKNGSDAFVEAMRISNNGNVGIGTTSPTALLDVNGDTVRVRTARTPASAAAAGNAGDICWDADYIYVCTATDTWKRAAISTW